MTATPNPQIEQAPICPCHHWPMLQRTGHLGWLCLWCGRTVEWDGRPGRWRPEMPSDLVKWGHTERPGDAVNVPGHGRPDGKEWST
jgi:hypothetical protein